MDQSYFNHHAQNAEGYWERRDFVHKLWRIYSGDAYWVPPHYPTLRRALEPKHNPHLARLSPHYLHLEALPKPRQGGYATELERPVAAAVFAFDGRRQDRSCYLSLFHAVNDRASLRYLLDAAAEALAPLGLGSLVGPVGLSPHLGSGALLSHWNLLPPLHTPYNPPYLPELLASRLELASESRLYHLERSSATLRSGSRARLVPLAPERLMGDLLPLFAAACPAGGAEPDKEEVAFILRWLSPFPLFGWLAEEDGQPVGFVLLQGDHALSLRRSWGGRSLWGRLRLKRASRRQVKQGRLLFGAVLSEGQGIGSQLLARALEAFTVLSIGPLPQSSAAASWLIRRGAVAVQRYGLYVGDL